MWYVGWALGFFVPLAYIAIGYFVFITMCAANLVGLALFGRKYEEPSDLWMLVISAFWPITLPCGIAYCILEDIWYNLKRKIHVATRPK